MKRLICSILTGIMLIGLLPLFGCVNDQNKIFIADEQLQAEADDILDSIGEDQRIDQYLSMRDELIKYNTTTRPAEVKQHLELLKNKYSGLDKDLSLDQGVGYVNEQLFEYLVVRAYYANRTLDGALMDSADRAVSIINEKGYKLVYEWQSDKERKAVRYYYGNRDVHDDLNYYSIVTVENGSVEYMSIPLFYEPLTEQFMESYAAKNKEERKSVFDSSVKYFAERAKVADNPVLALIYTQDELQRFQSFLNELDIDFLDENNITKEDEPYSNRQIPVELGNTRFLLRITIYGMFMDVIQSKDYFTGSFYNDLSVLRHAYLGAAPAKGNDESYIVIGG